MGYVNHLAHERRWLAGNEMMFRRLRRRRTHLGHRLPGRNRVGRIPCGKILVRPHEVAPVVPPAPDRSHGRRCPGPPFTPTSISECRPRMIATRRKTCKPRPPRHARARKACSASGRRALGFETVRVTRPDAIAPAGERLLGLPGRRTPRHDGLAGNPCRPPPRPASTSGPRCVPVVMLGHELRARDRSDGRARPTRLNGRRLDLRQTQPTTTTS